MADPLSDDADDDQPLDPAVERMRRKLARLMVGSIGVMVLGLVAVFAAIVYKLAAPPERPQGDTTGAAAITLPGGAAIVGTDLDGDRIMVRIRLPDGAERLLIHDRRSGERLGQIEIRIGP